MANELPDETIPGTLHGAATDETEILPPPTEAAPGLPWSLDDDPDDEEADPRPWGMGLGHAAAGVAVAFVIALVVGVVVNVAMAANCPQYEGN